MVASVASSSDKKILDYSDIKELSGNKETTGDRGQRRLSPFVEGKPDSKGATTGFVPVTVDPASLSETGNTRLTSTGEISNSVADYFTGQEIGEKLFSSKSMDEVHLTLFNQLETEDRSFESIDVIKNPGNYTARQRFIMYLDLQLNQVKYQKFAESFKDNGQGINNGKEIGEDFKNSLEILSSDPEVQSMMTQATFKAFKTIFSGNEIAPVDGEGKSGMEIMEIRLQRSENMQALRKEVMDGFDRDIVNGGLLKSGLALGKDVKTIMQEYTTALGVYSMVLPDKSYFDSIPGVWPGMTYDECMEKANKTYSEFFTKNVLDDLPDTYETMEGLWRAGNGSDVDEAVRKGVGSIIPVVDASQLTLGGEIFKTISSDYTAIQAAAKKDFDWKEGDGVSNLFRPTVEIMAQQYYGTDPGKKADRELFVSNVLKELDPLLQKASDREMSVGELHQELARVSFEQLPPGTNLNSYRQVIGTALEGLLFGASQVSKLPDNPDTSTVKGEVQKGLSGYSVNDIVTSITIATGLAGQGVAASGGNSAADRFMSTGAMADIAVKMFGTEKNAWSEAAIQANPATMDMTFWTDSIEKMSMVVTGEVKKVALPGTVVDPTVVTQKDKEAQIGKIFAPSIEALAIAYFNGDEKAMASYNGNLTTIAIAMWSLARPDGNFETLKTQISDHINKTVTTAPEGVGLAKYKEALLSGASAIFQGARAVWAGTNMEKPTWDSIGVLVLHSTASLSAVLKAAGAGVEKSKFVLGSLLLLGDEVIAAERKVISTILKNSSTILSGFAAVAWAPVDFYQFFSALKGGQTDTASLVFMGVGTAADTVGAIEGLVSLGELLLNSSFIRGSGAAAAAPLRLLPPVFGTFFTGATIISWAAWAGLAIYQVALREKEFDKRRDQVDDDLTRLLDDKLSLFYIKSDSTDRNGVPYKDDDAERTLTPQDWTAIKNGVDDYRRANGYGDWAVPR